MTVPPAESDAAGGASPTAPADAAHPSLLDEHRGFVLGIDDASRRAYSLLALGSMVMVGVALWVTDTAVLSWRTLWLAPLVFMAALVIGRFAALARWESRLRARVVDYCGQCDVDLGRLVAEAQTQGRYAFFVKLFAAAPGRRQT